MPSPFSSTVAVLTLLVCPASCTSVPPESVELSKLVGEMIQSAKASHLNMVNKHFAYRVSEVERFAFNEYKAAFLDNVRSVMGGEDQNFVELSLSQYDQAMERVRNKADEWVDEVRDNQRSVLAALEEHYTVLLASNEEVTSLLRSAADLSETRATLLARWGPNVGISSTKIEEVEQKIESGSQSVNQLMAAALDFGGN